MGVITPGVPITSHNAGDHDQDHNNAHLEDFSARHFLVEGDSGYNHHRGRGNGNGHLVPVTPGLY